MSLTPKFLSAALITGLALLTTSCAEKFPAADYQNLGDKYNVVIERDIRGVPHVIGERDVDAAFGFAYAQAEDNWELVYDTIDFYRGTAAKTKGPDSAITDFLVKWLGIWDDIDAHYSSGLSPEIRAYIEAYADGLNYYAALNPERAVADLPVTGKDIIAGYMFRHILFYGFDGVLKEVLSSERQQPISTANGVVYNGLPVGSNATAISPLNSTDGATRLAINSHQPTTGPVAWYEAHIQSGEGLNAMGGLFPGSATIGVGFNENIAWGATVNKPDLVDVYVLDIDPEDPLRYRIDGEWRDLEVTELSVDVKLWGFLPWTTSELGLRSIHGPVLQTDHGTYAIRYAGMGKMRQVEQWLAMNKAQNLEQWRDALRIHSFASFNFVYADRDSNIMFVHNSLTPVRVGGYDWSQYLPGDDSSLIWQDYMAFDKLPQVINPESGFIHSANQSPFFVTATGSNPKIADYRPEDGFPTRMTNRAVRGLEMFAELSPISEDEFSQIKHDKKYSPNSRAVRFLQGAINLPLADSAQQSYIDAQAVIRDWDLSTDIENRGAAISTCVIGVEWLAEQKGEPTPDVADAFYSCADRLMAATGRIDPLWGDVNRHVRGDLNLPVGGGPDTLRAIYALGMEEDGYQTNIAGDGLYYFVSWDAQGVQKIRGVHQFGAATLDTQSPHYADQAEDYTAEILHDPLFDSESRKDKLLRRYRPGE
ncbi:acylase [Porticoccaceae bacterium]|nr:acylase [Porticoccaceae bacterium]MDB4581105.1 acylase [Porticoccaceae bacterium]MDC0589887.1 acylase [Porticoccaceae bacterium]